MLFPLFCFNFFAEFSHTVVRPRQVNSDRLFVDFSKFCGLIYQSASSPLLNTCKLFFVYFVLIFPLDFHIKVVPSTVVNANSMFVIFSAFVALFISPLFRLYLTPASTLSFISF